MLLHSRALRCIDAPPSSSSSTPHSPHQGQAPGLIHQLPTLPIELFTRIISLLTTSDLGQFTLSCWAARNMVYAAHVNKLTVKHPYTAPNMRALVSHREMPRYKTHPQLFELKWPKRAVMSQRYPAVSHIAISSEYCNPAADFCDALVSSNGKNSMRGITHLDIDLTVFAESTSVMKSLSQLLRICTALKCLKLRLDVKHYSKQQTLGNLDFEVSLTLCEQAPGQGLQHHHRLVAHGVDLEHILDTAACITQLHQVALKPHNKDNPHYNVLCNALPRLSTLQELCLEHDYFNPVPYTSQQRSMLTRLELSNIGHSCLHLDLDLPALKELTLVSCTPSAASCASSMHSLTYLSISGVQLLPNNGMWGLTSLRHLSFGYCCYEGTTAALNSNLQALSGLTCLHAACIIYLDTPDEVHATASLHLNNALQLSELKLCCYEYDALQHIPTSLTSLSVFVRMVPKIKEVEYPMAYVYPPFKRTHNDYRYLEDATELPTAYATIARLPLTWLCCSQLRRLLVGGHCAWGQALPLLAQLTTLEHLELVDREIVNSTVDASCLDALAELTCLKLDIGMKLAALNWPLLSKSTRLQQLEVFNCWSWPTLPLPSSLVRLQITTNGYIPLPAHLSSCRSLQHLTVQSWHYKAPMSGISSLAPLTTLQHLCLSGHFAASITDVAAIAHLTNLQHLKLGSIRSTSLHCLGPLNQLTEIWLGVGIRAELQEVLPRLLESGLFPNLKDRFYLRTVSQ